MKTINEIQDDELLFNEQTHSQIYACDLKHEWNSLNEDERSGWRTLKERTIKLYAKSVLDWIYDGMDSEGYEDMFDNLWDDTDEEFKQRMQGLLDEISNFPSAKVYDIDEGINPFVDLEEEHMDKTDKIKNYKLFRREGGFLKVSEKGVEILNDKGDTYAYIVSENKIDKHDYASIEKESEEQQWN